MARATGRQGTSPFVADADSDRILGCHIVGPDAGNLVHEAVIAMVAGATYTDIGDAIHIHPTLAEGITRPRAGSTARRATIDPAGRTAPAAADREPADDVGDTEGAPMGLVKDTMVAAAAGYAGTKAMEQAGTRLMTLEPEQDRQREQHVRPGPPFMLAADNVSSRVLGVDLDDQQRQKAGMTFHYAAGLAWASVYQLLRRRSGMRPVAAGLVTGASQSLILDETVTPSIGASAPNREYPLSTHLRGFAAHLAFGLAIAAVTEFGWKALGGRA